jgi:hypothetical protein
MRTSYSITLSLQVPAGVHYYGTFQLGENRKEAKSVFKKLKGKKDPVSGCCIQMELSEKIGGIAVSINVLNCCTEDLKENIALITREIFRISQLEKDG